MRIDSSHVGQAFCLQSLPRDMVIPHTDRSRHARVQSYVQTAW